MKPCRICPNPRATYSCMGYCVPCQSQYQYWRSYYREFLDPSTPRCTYCRKRGQVSKKLCRACYEIYLRTGGKRVERLINKPGCKYCINPRLKHKKIHVRLCYFCFYQIKNAYQSRLYYSKGGYQGLLETTKNNMRKAHLKHYYKNRDAMLARQRNYDIRKGIIQADKNVKMAKIRLEGKVYLFKEWVLSNPHINYQKISKQANKIGTYMGRGVE